MNTHVTLKNGVTIPAIGFGTWQISDGKDAYEAVITALEAGYRHIDTALAYRNEKSVGKALIDSKIPREEIFVTTKLPAEIKGYQAALAAFRQSLENLGLDYVDLYLIHAPKPWGETGDGSKYLEQNIASWLAFETLYREGKIRSIGVSNFSPQHLMPLIARTTIVPHVNQILLNPKQIPQENIDYCRKMQIAIEAYSPLGTGRIFSDESLIPLAQKYGKTVAQLCIRWSLQAGFIPLPKSVTPARIRENLDVDFVITNGDMDKIGLVK